MNHRHLFSVCLMALFGLASVVFVSGSEKVIQYDKRVALLERVKDIEYSNQALQAKFADMAYPFAFEKEEEKKEEKEEEKEFVEQKLTDEQVLQNTADSIKPLGTMELGGRRIMTMVGGRLEEAQVIRTMVQGEEKVIIVEKITRNFFELRLNDATLRKSIKKLSAGSSITRDSRVNTDGQTAE